MNSSHIVIGLGYGDEGKGLVTDSLAAELKNSIVIRFSGGPQAGHHVTLKDGTQHMFSNFGAGTLRNVPAFWSKYCPVDPVVFMNEYRILETLGFKPTLFVDPECPMITPVDIVFNRTNTRYSDHGTVGAGFGATVERHLMGHHMLFARDLDYPEILMTKVRQFENWQDYGVKWKIFEYAAEFMRKHSVRLSAEQTLSDVDHLIFEGSQGILLDQNYGFYPHVTHSNTTCKNALNIMAKIDRKNAQLHYVTRAYHTRHGNGPLPGEDPSFKVNNPNETNVQHRYQGPFRYAPLHLESLQYALSCDSYHHPKDISEKNIVVTCMDQGDFTHVPLGIRNAVQSLGSFRIYTNNAPYASLSPL